MSYRTLVTRFSILACLLVLVALPSPFSSAKAPRSDKAANEAAAKYDAEWVKLTYSEASAEGDEGEPIGLETAIASYTGHIAGSRLPIVVELVGAVHVGDAAYYAELNKRFKGHEVVLFELVAPEGTVIPRGGRARSDNLLGMMQNGMKDLLGLEHQLEQVDYTAENFVHADMSPTELFASMEKKDEGIVSMYFRLMGQAIGEQTKQKAKGQSSELDLLKALMSTEDRPRKLKVAMASQMTELESLLTNFGGKDGSTLIHERNKVALEGLREQVKLGKRHISIFYGAGHLADMDKRLVDEFGLKQVSKEWLTAWDLKPSSK